VRETRTYAVMEEIKRDAPLPVGWPHAVAIVIAAALIGDLSRQIAYCVQSQRLSSNARIVFW